MKVDYIDHMGSDLTVVNAARVSFNKETEEFREQDEKLLKYLASHGHWTPFAHPQITLRIKAPVFVRTQCFKHKVGFVENEVSRRYVDEDPEFFTPEEWRGAPSDGAKQGSSGVVAKGFDIAMYQVHLKASTDYYKWMLSVGIAPEQARMLLPQSMYTEWYWTGSLMAYARFFNQRIDPHAQKEIRDLAEMIGDIIEPLFPVSWRYLVEEG